MVEQGRGGGATARQRAARTVDAGQSGACCSVGRLRGSSAQRKQGCFVKTRRAVLHQRQRGAAAQRTHCALTLHSFEPRVLAYLPGGQELQLSCPASSLNVPLGLHGAGGGGGGRARMHEHQREHERRRGFLTLCGAEARALAQQVLASRQAGGCGCLARPRAGKLTRGWRSTRQWCSHMCRQGRGRTRCLQAGHGGGGGRVEMAPQRRPARCITPCKHLRWPTGQHDSPTAARAELPPLLVPTCHAVVKPDGAGGARRVSFVLGLSAPGAVQAGGAAERGTVLVLLRHGKQ